MFEYLADPGEFLKKYLGKDDVSNKMPNKFPNEELRKNIIAYIKHELAGKIEKVAACRALRRLLIIAFY